MIFLKHVFIISMLIFYVSSAENCKIVNVSISQNVENEGFHKEIHWLIEFPTKIELCKVCLQLVVPSGMYVNPDELSDLNRFGKISAVIDGVVDVEKPAHESEPHIVFVYLPSYVDKVLVKLPIHLRYQRALLGGSYGKVVLLKPSLLVQCLEDEVGSCKTLHTVEAPCDAIGTDICRWHNTSYQSLFDDVELLVPIGNLDDYPVVSFVTLLLGCAGTIYVLSILSSASV